MTFDNLVVKLFVSCNSLYLCERCLTENVKSFEEKCEVFKMYFKMCHQTEIPHLMINSKLSECQTLWWTLPFSNRGRSKPSATTFVTK